MRRSIWTALALAGFGCSALFDPSQYTGERDAGSQGGDAGSDGGAEDAGARDGGPDAATDGGGRDAGDGGERDAGGDGGRDAGDGGSPPTGPLPTCGDGAGTPGFTDAQPAARALSPALLGALFPGGTVSEHEAGLVYDSALPAPAAGEGSFVDVAVARGAAPDTWLVVGATGGGALRVHVARLVGGLAIEPLPIAVTWIGGPPDSIDRIAMRSRAGSAMVAVLGDLGAIRRGWICTGSESAGLSCEPTIDLPGYDGVAIATVGTALQPLFVNAATAAYRPSDAGPAAIDTDHVPRMSGTDGPLVYAPVAPRDVWVFVLGATSGFSRSQIDVRQTEGAGGITWLGGDSYEAVRAINRAGDYTLDARAVTCVLAGCSCPPDTGCGSAPVVSPLTVTGAGAVSAVEVLTAGDAALAVVGAGGTATGTDVSLFAFDVSTHEHIAVATDAERVVLGNGMLGSTIGTLVPGVGMRAAIAATPFQVDLVQAALVDLYVSGGGPTREIFVSALRVCRNR